jgi:hypothetical protein
MTRDEALPRRLIGTAVCVFLAGSLLAGCQTEEQFDEEFFQQWTEEWTGRPLSEYVDQRGLQPTSYYDVVPGRRVFVFERIGYVPQLVTGSVKVEPEPVTCRRVIETDQVGEVETDLSAYQIVRVSTSDMAC